MTILVGWCTQTREETPQKDKGHIIVVWAGIAGITAAKDLHDAWYRVTVLEASNRIGGRLFTAPLSSWVSVDLWASWVHGITNNPIKNLVDEYGIKNSVTDYDNAAIISSWKKISDQKLGQQEKIVEDFWEYVEEKQEWQSDTWLVVYMYSYAQRLSLESRKLFLHYLHNETTNDIAADPEFVSSKNILQESEQEWDDVFVHWYMQLVEKMASWLVIQTWARVIGIEYGSGWVTVFYNSWDVLTWDKVVVTVPLWVLKKWVITFSPTLPQRKIDAISWLEMWLLMKTFLQFDRVFRDTDTEILWYADHPQQARSFWVNAYPYIKQPVLLGLNGWQYARYLEWITDEEIIADAMKSLRAMYGDAIPEPTHYAISRWWQDPNSYGSYSYVPVGSRDDLYDIMAESVDDTVYFAWEATDKQDHSTVLWAYRSGKREAKKIIESTSTSEYQ